MQASSQCEGTLKLTKVNSELVRVSGVVFGLAGLMAWILFIPGSAQGLSVGENWETIVVFLGLATLVAVVVASSVSLINFHRGATPSGKRRLRIVSTSGIMIGLLGILSWVSWILAVMNAEAAQPPYPGAPYPSSAEVWGFLIALVLLMTISSLVLIKSVRTRAIHLPTSI